MSLYSDAICFLPRVWAASVSLESSCNTSLGGVLIIEHGMVVRRTRCTTSLRLWTIASPFAGRTSFSVELSFLWFER